MNKKVIVIGIILILIVTGLSGCETQKRIDTYVDFEFNFINNWNKTASIILVPNGCYLGEDLVSTHTYLEPNNSTIKYSNHSHGLYQFISFQVQVIDYYTTYRPPERELKNYDWEVKSNSVKFIIIVNENGKIEINDVTN